LLNSCFKSFKVLQVRAEEHRVIHVLSPLLFITPLRKSLV
jgi:hypothetical protein